MGALEVDARPVSVHLMDARPVGFHSGMEALLQRMVVYEATVPPGAIEGQRVHPYMQPAVRLTLPAGAIPGTVVKWVNMETAVPASWEPGVQLMTTLRSGTRVRIMPPSDASAGQCVEFSVPFVMLTDELRAQLLELEALQRALAASPDNAALRGQLSSLESLVQRSLAAQLRPPSPPPSVPMPVPMPAPVPVRSGAVQDEAALHTVVDRAVRSALDSTAAGWVEAARLELRGVAAQLQGEAKAEHASQGASTLRLLEAVSLKMSQLQQKQQEQQAVLLQAWLDEVRLDEVRLDEATRALALHGQQAAAPSPHVSSAAPPAAPPPAIEPATSWPRIETVAVACQAGGGLYSEPAAQKSPAPSPSRPAAAAARIVSASAHLSARRVDIPRAADWRWYHQVHAEPPGPLGGHFLR